MKILGLDGRVTQSKTWFLINPKYCLSYEKMWKKKMEEKNQKCEMQMKNNNNKSIRKK